MQKAREDMLTLWILFCRMTEKWDTLFTFYNFDLRWPLWIFWHREEIIP